MPLRTPLQRSIAAVEDLDRRSGGALWFHISPAPGAPPDWLTVRQACELIPQAHPGVQRGHGFGRGSLLDAYEEGNDERSARAVQGSLLLEAWAWSALTPALHLLFFDGTVLELGDPSVQIFAPRGGRPAALGIDAAGPLGREPRHAAPGDPAGIDLLAGPAIAFHQPLIDALHAETGRSKRALWRSVRDRLASAIMASGEAFGRPELADAMLARVLERWGVTGGRPRFVRAPGRRPALARGGCCLWWRTGSPPCDGCPIALAGEPDAT